LFQIEHIENTILLKDSKSESFAHIFLDLGGSLQELTLKTTKIIKNLKSVDYNNSFSSAILFPFTNRIKGGKYSFNNQKYELELNENNENAIHGLVHNKKYKLVSKETSEDYAKVTLSYKEDQKPIGFPFDFELFLTYTLSKKSLNLEVKVKNTDAIPFPFTLGWHPYFYSSDLFNSYLSFSSTKKIVFDKKMIPVEVENISPIHEKFQIKNNKYDDCYIVNDKYLYFETPNYSIDIKSSSNENYFQLYTPYKLNSIAIEPMTGPSNSFNNKLGLKILKPNEDYHVNWEIKLINSKP